MILKSILPCRVLEIKLDVIHKPKLLLESTYKKNLSFNRLYFFILGLDIILILCINGVLLLYFKRILILLSTKV
jgi:hypothetical protein